MELLDTACLVAFIFVLLLAGHTHMRKIYDYSTLLCMLAVSMAAVNLALQLLLDSSWFTKSASIGTIAFMTYGGIDSVIKYIREIYGPHNLDVHVDIGRGPDWFGYYDTRTGKVYSRPRDGWEISPETVKKLCSMFHSEANTRGYMPDTPLGEIAREGFLHWLRVKQNTEFAAQWVKLSDMFPQKGDLSARGEILAKDKDGFCHVCDPFNNITREDGTIEWFNGDCFIVPVAWMKIPLW